MAFYDGARLLAEAIVAPYTFEWSTATSGNHLLTRHAIDNAGAETVSSPRFLTVAGGQISFQAKLSAQSRNDTDVQDFEISSDNKWVVYRGDQEGNGVTELFLRPTAGSDSPMKLNDALVSGGSVQEYALSPDGRWVIYLADQLHREIPELYARRLGETFYGPRNVSTSTADLVFDFKISSDSKWTVYRGINGKSGAIGVYSRAFRERLPFVA